MVLLEPPESDSHLAIIDVDASEADLAVAAAWAAYRPTPTQPLKRAFPGALGNSWDEARAHTYETSPNERVKVSASARRAGMRWTVIIQDFTQSTFGKRTAGVFLVYQSVRPKGYQRASFSRRRAHLLDARMKQCTTNSLRHLTCKIRLLTLLGRSREIMPSLMRKMHDSVLTRASMALDYSA